MQPVQRVPPATLVHELVPLGDLVPERAPRVGLVAERRAAVHASRALRREQRLGRLRAVVPVHFVPIRQALVRVAVPERLALVVHKPRSFLGVSVRVGRTLSGSALLVFSASSSEGRDGFEPCERVLLGERLRLGRVLLGGFLRVQHALVVARVHLDELLFRLEPIPEDGRRDGGVGAL